MKSELSVDQKVAFSQYRSRSPPFLLPETMRGSERNSKSSSDLNVSFGYQCNAYQYTSTEVNHESEHSTTIQIQDSKIKFRSSSFSCLSGAALSANATLANTNICNGLIGEEILPGLDSPTSFRRMTSSSSISRLDLLSSSSQSSMSTLSGIVSTDSDGLESCRNFWNSMSAPAGIESSSFLNAVDVQTAGGAAGEDRVQAVCSEENGWLFCGVYDGFNGRDAADFLAGTLYENIRFYLYLLECQIKQRGESSGLYEQKYLQCSSSHKTMKSELSLAIKTSEIENKSGLSTNFSYEDFSSESFRLDVLDCLVRALAQAESDFIYMVEQEMVDRPDLVSVGSSVLAVLLHGMDLYVLNLGDSRAVLATANSSGNGTLEAIQLTEIHTIDNEAECKKVLADHPDDPSPIIGGKVKGKLKLTRALGVGYLKKGKLNNALMGILRVPNLCSPPYVYTHPFTISHKMSKNDLFVILGSDGLFDFFTNDEVVNMVHWFIQDNPSGDPAKYLVEQLVLKAAKCAGFTTEELMRVPVGRRRKYHDDVTVIVIILGNKQQTSTASTLL